jgi:carbon-monoxide dehydrogenase medium subunit
VYYAPATIDEAVELLADYAGDAKVLGGGQSLIPMMNMRLSQPSALVDVTRIPQLAHIDVGDETSIGAAVPQHVILRNPQMAMRFPIVHAALRHVGHPANRARGTFGGSIAHAEPAAEIPAIVLALGGTMVVRGQSGERLVPADTFFVTRHTTKIGADEILIQVRLPDQPPTIFGFHEVARRHGDLALAGAALTAHAGADGLIRSPRLVLFGVSDRPVRATAAEAVLAGTRVGDAGAACEAAKRSTDGVDFASDAYVTGDYRREACSAAVERAILGAAPGPEDESWLR